METTTRRLFLALWPSASELAAVLQWQGGWTWPSRASRTRAERMHVTLHFLGEIERDPRELASRLRVPFAPFTIEFGRPVLWHASLAVLEPLSAPAGLLRLQADLGAALREAGVAVEDRRYRPHVTLARRASHAVAPVAGPAFSWRADRYVLVESVPDSGYRILESFPAR